MASPLALFAIAMLGVRVVSGAWPDVGALACRDAAWWLGGLAAALAYGVDEETETGWRGFLLPRLQARRSALAATFLLTLAWAAWHAVWNVVNTLALPVSMAVVATMSTLVMVAALVVVVVWGPR